MFVSKTFSDNQLIRISHKKSLSLDFVNENEPNDN